MKLYPGEPQVCYQKRIAYWTTGMLAGILVLAGWAGVVVIRWLLRLAASR